MLLEKLWNVMDNVRSFLYKDGEPSSVEEEENITIQHSFIHPTAS
jgi:hypothetical protein